MAMTVVWFLLFLGLLGGGLTLLLAGAFALSLGTFSISIGVLILRVWLSARARRAEEGEHGMRTASPWWFSLIFAANLVLIFLGERAFIDIDTARTLFTGVGVLGAVAITGLRVFTVTITRGNRRRIEQALLFCQLGALAALLLYALSTDGGRGLIGFGDLEGDAILRYQTPLTVLWSVLMALSLIPLLVIETSLGVARRGRFSPTLARTSAVAEEAVEAFRVREMASSGLLVALALSMLMVTCNIAEQRNIRRDVSYFKTSSPGESTLRIAQTARQPVRVLLFFPEVSQVKTEVLGYFRAIRDAGGRIAIEEHDRLRSLDLVRAHRVLKDGTVVLVYGDQWDSFELTVDPDQSRTTRARMELRELDGKVNAALLKVVRSRRVAYLTVGHGELNDELGTWGYGRTGAQSTQLNNVLKSLNYEIEPLGLLQGLGSEIPDDADLVMVLAPRQALSEPELATLDRYLARGGKLLIVLDPEAEAGLGLLEKRLGVRFDPTPVTDERNRIATINNPRAILTDRISSHASATALTRVGRRRGAPFLNAGWFESVDFEVDEPPRRTHVIRSMNNSFADLDNNFRFTEGSETRRQYSLMVAVETKEETLAKQAASAGEGEAAPEPMRVILLSDVDILIDVNMVRFPLVGTMMADIIKWLGGEEEIMGEIESEKDVRIDHTRGEDVLWFYATIVGAPFLVLGIGFFWSGSRRRRGQRRRS